MPNQESTETQRAHKISGPLHLYNCEDLKQGLLHYLKNSPVVTLDLSESSDCDLAGLQLICSAQRTAALKGKPFEVHLSQPITRTMKSFGLRPDYFTSFGGETEGQQSHE